MTDNDNLVSLQLVRETKQAPPAPKAEAPPDDRQRVLNQTAMCHNCGNRTYLVVSGDGYSILACAACAQVMGRVKWVKP